MKPTWINWRPQATKSPSVSRWKTPLKPRDWSNAKSSELLPRERPYHHNWLKQTGIIICWRLMEPCARKRLESPSPMCLPENSRFANSGLMNWRVFMILSLSFSQERFCWPRAVPRQKLSFWRNSPKGFSNSSASVMVRNRMKIWNSYSIFSILTNLTLIRLKSDWRRISEPWTLQDSGSKGCPMPSLPQGPC